MHPVVFRVGALTLHTYGLLVATGVLLGLWLAWRQAARSGLDPDRVWNLGIYMVLAALAGAKLWIVVSDWDYYARHRREIFAYSTILSGGVYYGGLLTALLFAFFYARRFRLAFLPLADVYAAPLALGHAIGRLGCFAAGCCYGKPTSLAWGVTFTDPYARALVGTPLGVPLHPTQLYEAATEFLIFVFLVFLGRRRRFPGQLFAAYAVLYGLTRGTIEFFRGDPDRTLLAGGRVSLMQAVSVALLIVGGALLLRGDTSKRPAV
ncbi:MAG: prolipoprotein diacylglyceryl transferase [Acidobacteria bacterium]|nr:prolipoprotein diacylglyceryl transferase [Acidobacteriota bacterium]